MRVYGDSSRESRYESSDGRSDSSAGVSVDDLPSNAAKKFESVAVSQRLLQLLLVVTRNELVPGQQN